mgnify:FL=1
MTREKFAFISLVAIIACVLFYQVDSAFSDKLNLNWLFAGLGSVLGVYAIVSLIIGFKK